MNKFLLFLLVSFFSVMPKAEAVNKPIVNEDWSDLSDISKQGALSGNTAEPKLLPSKTNSPLPVELKNTELLDQIINDMPLEEIDFGLEDKISKILAPKTPEAPEIYNPGDLTSRRTHDFHKVPSKFFQINNNKGQNTHLPKFMQQSELSQMLFAAVLDSNINAIRTLLQKGANINVHTKKSGMTPVMIAVRYNKVDSLRYLIAKGADLNIQSADGKTALHYAAIHDTPKMFEILAKSGSKPYLKDNDGVIANEYANPGQKSRYYLLLARSIQADPEELRSFAKISSLVAVNYLIEEGVDFNIPDSSGNTALMMAAAQGDHQMTSFLLAKGALFDNHNINGFTALDLAKQSGEFNTIALIETAIISRELETGESPAKPMLTPILLEKDSGHFLQHKKKGKIKSQHNKNSIIQPVKVTEEKASQSIIMASEVYETIMQVDHQSVVATENESKSENKPAFLEKIMGGFNFSSVPQPQTSAAQEQAQMNEGVYMPAMDEVKPPKEGFDLFNLFGNDKHVPGEKFAPSKVKPTLAPPMQEVFEKPLGNVTPVHLETKKPFGLMRSKTKPEAAIDVQALQPVAEPAAIEPSVLGQPLSIVPENFMQRKTRAQ